MILLLAAVLGYAGNEACARCHPTIYQSYSQTPMSRSSGKVPARDARAGEFGHAPSGITYRVDRRGDRLVLSYERSGNPPLAGEQELHYFIGSGAAGRTYLFEIGRYLFQSPVTWYSQKSKWDMSPGYEHDREMKLNRPIEPSCLYCHASGAQPILGTQNRYAPPPFTQAGVGCERCHGPGEAHARGSGPIVNPAKLGVAERNDVCSQCHLSGEARIEKAGRKLAMYRPGERLSDYVTYFVFGGSEPNMKATSHVEKLAHSRCKQGSGDRLWCGTCHDPHSVPPAAERAAWYRQRCATCHKPAECSRGPDCASCHMPRVKVVDGGHGVLTDHSIPRRASGPYRAARAGSPLVPFGGGTADTRSLGLAYAEVALRSRERFHAAEAWRLLAAAISAHPDDPELLTRLAFLAEQQNEPKRAAQLYEAALRWDPNRTVALVNLGGLTARAGDLERATELWTRALATNAGLTEAGLNLATALRARSEPKRALDALNQVLRYQPDLAKAREMMSEFEGQRVQPASPVTAPVPPALRR